MNKVFLGVLAICALLAPATYGSPPSPALDPLEVSGSADTCATVATPEDTNTQSGIWSRCKAIAGGVVAIGKKSASCVSNALHKGYNALTVLRNLASVSQEAPESATTSQVTVWAKWCASNLAEGWLVDRGAPLLACAFAGLTTATVLSPMLLAGMPWHTLLTAGLSTAQITSIVVDYVPGAQGIMKKQSFKALDYWTHPKLS